MLIRFSFKNFKSFRDEAILDLSAAKMTEFSDRVVLEGNEKIFFFFFNKHACTSHFSLLTIVSHFIIFSTCKFDLFSLICILLSHFNIIIVVFP